MSDKVQTKAELEATSVADEVLQDRILDAIGDAATVYRDGYDDVAELHQSAGQPEDVCRVADDTDDDGEYDYYATGCADDGSDVYGGGCDDLAALLYYDRERVYVGERCVGCAADDQ